MKKNRKKQLDPAAAAPVCDKQAPTETKAHPLEDCVRQRAYEIHQARGGAPGRELDDWLQAEREIKAVRNQG